MFATWNQTFRLPYVVYIRYKIVSKKPKTILQTVLILSCWTNDRNIRFMEEKSKDFFRIADIFEDTWTCNTFTGRFCSFVPETFRWTFFVTLYKFSYTSVNASVKLVTDIYVASNEDRYSVVVKVCAISKLEDIFAQLLSPSRLRMRSSLM